MSQIRNALLLAFSMGKPNQQALRCRHHGVQNLADVVLRGRCKSQANKRLRKSTLKSSETHPS